MDSSELEYWRMIFCMDLVDFPVDVCRYLEDAGATVNFKYDEFQHVYHSDDIAQTSPDDDRKGRTEITKVKGVIAWEKQGRSRMIVSDGQTR
jgi:hypothetical protein